jgi:hypothetical protein
MIVIELVFAGFFSAIGWWGADHYLIEPYFPQSVEQTEQTRIKK